MKGLLLIFLCAPVSAQMRAALPAPVLPTAKVSVAAPHLPAAALPSAPALVLPKAAAPAAVLPALPALQAKPAAAAVAAAQAPAPAALPAAAEAARPALAGKSSWPTLFDGSGKAAAVNAALDARPEPAYASARTAYELYREVDSFYTRLAALHDADRRGERDLAPRKRALLTALVGLDARLNGAPAAGYPAAAANLRASHAEKDAARAALLAAMRAGAPAGDVSAGSERQRRADAALVAAQVRAALMLLDGSAPLSAKELRRNAAMMTLIGARSSAQSLWAETAYGEARILGRPQAAAPAAVPTRRWHNAETLLDEAARDARNGRLDAAGRTLSGLETLFTQTPGLLPEGVAAQAEEVRGRVVEARAALAAGNAQALQDAVAAARAAVPLAKLDAPGVIVYRDAAAARRGRGHMLESMAAEGERVAARAAEVGFWAEVLSAAEARPLTTMENAAFSSFLERARGWTSRGFVRAKQEASESLAAAEEAALGGSFALASARLAQAQRALEGRVAQLAAMREAVAARPERSVAADTRHEALVEAAARWSRMLRRPLDAQKADDLAGEVRNHREAYLSEEEPGLPGYTRAAADLEALEKALVAQDQSAARAAVARFSEDLTHRRSLRITVSLRQAKSGGTVRTGDRFVLPGTTLRTLLKRVGGIPEKPQVRIDGGEWTDYGRLNLRGKLADETRIEILLDGSVR